MKISDRLIRMLKKPEPIEAFLAADDTNNEKYIHTITRKRYGRSKATN